METKSVFYEVETEFFNIILMILVLEVFGEITLQIVT
jgi:hypothetical protein